MSKHRIAVIPGDGIAREVMPPALEVLDVAARKFGIDLSYDHFDWSCDNYARHNYWMPPNWKDLIGGHTCIFFGATGMPSIVPDHVSLWDSLIHFRREFDQYGMVMEMPFDLVAEVTSLRGRVIASSKANFMMRSQPFFVKVEVCCAISRSVPTNRRPPTEEYSPSVFSRTT